MSESWEGWAWWLSESGQAIHVGWTNEVIVEKYNLTIVQLLMKLKILGATCQSNTATWRQDQGSTYHPRFQISIFCLNTFFFFFLQSHTQFSKWRVGKIALIYGKQIINYAQILISQHLRPILHEAGIQISYWKSLQGPRITKPISPKRMFPQLSIGL